MKLDGNGTETGPVWKRLAWFVAIWASSVAALGIVAYFLRFWLALG